MILLVICVAETFWKDYLRWFQRKKNMEEELFLIIF